jgi:hypothetical protein
MNEAFEWDEGKRRRVLRDRGLDFIDGALLFDGRPILTLPSNRDSEERWLSLGELNGQLIAIVWTQRNQAIRIVTMRRTRDEEKRQYRAIYGQTA